MPTADTRNADPRLQFWELVEELHLRAGLDLPARSVDAELPMEAVLTHQGEEFRLVHATGAAGDRLHCTLHVGAMEPGHEARLLRSVLQTNAALGPDAGGAFCADEEKKELLYVFCLLVAGLDVQQLEDQLDRASGFAAILRASGAIVESGIAEDPAEESWQAAVPDTEPASALAAASTAP